MIFEIIEESESIGSVEKVQKNVDEICDGEHSNEFLVDRVPQSGEHNAWQKREHTHTSDVRLESRSTATTRPCS